MAALSELVQRFMEQERGAANILPLESVTAQALAAARFHAGFADIAAIPEGADVAADTDISVSEWAQIRPLFLLYVERETALQLEATRSMGADPFGRSSSEVGNEITQMEADYPRRVFCIPVITV
ncbi:hypothetical protein PU634_05185 [Oceanimonas pelagia]|uniref:Uncharacterized protein n=1 Tax=Oceanimonas pelagia TaxID=3028314 RepID=A0AA50KRR0_9GAMM|nr:hypothetical protein [Oceanimonas pelagia]WMC11762.1 hypothetical protein PU634_05185 [Oceanimonas pelagia]